MRYIIEDILSIILEMATGKQNDESGIKGQLGDLYYHTFKVLIFEESYIGEYNYWQKDLISTFNRIDHHLFHGEYKRFKQTHIIKLFLDYFDNRLMLRLISSIYNDPKLTMLKRFNKKQDFINWFNVNIHMDLVINKLVNDLWDNDNVYKVIDNYFHSLGVPKDPTLIDIEEN